MTSEHARTSYRAHLYSCAVIIKNYDVKMISSAPSKRFAAIYNFPSKILYETQNKKILASNSLGGGGWHQPIKDVLLLYGGGSSVSLLHVQEVRVSQHAPGILRNRKFWALGSSLYSATQSLTMTQQ